MKTTTILIFAAVALGLVAILKTKTPTPLAGQPGYIIAQPATASPITGAISGLLGGLFGGAKNTLAPLSPTFTGSTAGQSIFGDDGVQIPSNVNVGSVNELYSDENSIDDPGFSIDSGADFSSSAFDDYDS